jgi:hypothetical protein
MYRRINGPFIKRYGLSFLGMFGGFGILTAGVFTANPILIIIGGSLIAISSICVIVSKEYERLEVGLTKLDE